MSSSWHACKNSCRLCEVQQAVGHTEELVGSKEKRRRTIVTMTAEPANFDGGRRLRITVSAVARAMLLFNEVLYCTIIQYVRGKDRRV